ncbi:hypothetical protein XELAEV_18008424mg [Xenopus laevis]|uniref:Reverse transcriptase domain-containing protein n=1 Tax=Xenopus laevis TaxID=8355 RepID=A0A974E4F0_XENLA|nr:hypothetical protein XELAEV_18008424mg [Xenopus laevis]
MDVESLYTNIPHEDGIAACQHFLEINHMPTVPTVQLIRFILTHNYFSLGDAIYLQLMGWHLNLTNSTPPSTLPLTTLTHTSTSWIQPSTSTMEPYKHPYTKNQQAVLHVLIQALRYNRICSNLDDRNKHLHSLRKTFVNQGFHPQVIDDQIHRATQIPKDTLLDYKEKTENNRKNSQRPATHAPYRYPTKTNIPGTTSLIPPNLRKMIVRSLFLKQLKQVHLCKDQVAIPNTQKVYTILDHYSCASSNVVYVITCN